MPQKRERLDKLLVERGIADSRSRAQAKILAGEIMVDGFPARKPASMVHVDSTLEIAGVRDEWASRGAHKLLKAIESFGVPVKGRRCVDIGASTGGFTDVLLQKGAEKVYAVDVGYGQLAWKLRNDPRVDVLERTNAKGLSPDMFECPELVTVDVSFISLRHILPVADRILQEGGVCICLVKPQFEAGRGKVGKRGVVRDRAVHEEVLRELAGFVHCRTHFRITGVEVSPLLGPQGNREFFLCLVKLEAALRTADGRDDEKGIQGMIAESVEAAHRPGFFERENQGRRSGR